MTPEEIATMDTAILDALKRWIRRRQKQDKNIAQLERMLAEACRFLDDNSPGYHRSDELREWWKKWQS